MSRFLFAGLLLFAGLWAGAAWADRPVYALKVNDSEPPKEVAEAVGKLLETRSVQLLDRDEVIVELWFRKVLPVKATEVQIMNGLTYAEVPTSTLFGAVRIGREMLDYRKQKVGAGVYTLRLATQPADGDHAGTAPTTDFLLLCPAAEDQKPDLLEVKALRELSAKVGEEHPSPLLLFPGKGAGAEPKLVEKEMGHQVLLMSLNADADGKKGRLAIGLNLVGHSAKR
jgi:hypothetical protein